MLAAVDQMEHELQQRAWNAYFYLFYRHACHIHIEKYDRHSLIKTDFLNHAWVFFNSLYLKTGIDIIGKAVF